MGQTYKNARSTEETVRHPKRILRNSEYESDDEYSKYKPSDFKKMNVSEILEDEDDIDLD